MGPLASVVMPVRDGAAFLAEAVASILRQTMPRLELLAIDDGSRDATPAILAELAAGDPRIRVLSAPAPGLVAALNHGLAAAQGPYIARMDADDVAHPERLARQIQALEDTPEAAAVGSAWRVIGPDGAPRRTVRPPVAPGPIRAALRRANPMAHPSVTMRRGAVLALGGYRPCFLLAEDFDLWLRLSEHYDLINLPDPLLDYREHDAQVSWTRVEQRALSEMAALAAAGARRAGRADGCDGPDAADRDVLRRLGVPDASIAAGIVGRAMGSAKDALARGQALAARGAIACALRQPGQHPRTRAHLWLLRIRCGLG